MREDLDIDKVVSLLKTEQYARGQMDMVEALDENFQKLPKKLQNSLMALYTSAQLRLTSAQESLLPARIQGMPGCN
jgi:hypothetical protein